jgi:hypothetical protein
MFQNVSRGILRDPTVAIKTGSSALAKMTNSCLAIVNGTKVLIAAADLPALTTAASLASGEKNVVVFVTDAAGTVTNLYGTKATTDAAVLWPVVPADKTVIGFAYITAAATFTGGTTALDATNITTIYGDGAKVQPTFHV